MESVEFVVANFLCLLRTSSADSALTRLVRFSHDESNESTKNSRIPPPWTSMDLVFFNKFKFVFIYKMTKLTMEYFAHKTLNHTQKIVPSA
jgi:hypothetical protein